MVQELNSYPNPGIGPQGYITSLDGSLKKSREMSHYMTMYVKRKLQPEQRIKSVIILWAGNI